ncbi:TonB-dependent receptor [Pedobacter cryophilus]|uniref:TonB-dependent receptor n=1 Tax=Pedobacter cryophilus TaxID=2571271 RepID=A0A4U1C0R2_9SPHI|nr:TonB-dependent receptor [Pedobacter cryophilus]TKB98791.1 TonB-dependent receptor [Pedobacter cryophilus]
MIQKYFSILLKISFLLIISANQVYAQTGKIAGKVTDKTTGETLIGLTVGIEGTTKGAATDVEGRYVISNLAAGKYNLTFRYLGYKSKNVTGVDVIDGKVTSLDVIMEEAATQSLNEVVVTASYRQETVGALYAQQKNAVSISSGISSDQIRKSPDKNTSEVLRRVSGTSIQDGKFIVIRGLSDRYNTALLNNAILPSSEPDRKAFSFDIVPSNLVDKIVISKTASPDLPGDFAGGVTQIITKDIPDKNFFGVAITTGYNSQSTFKDFRSNGRNSTDFLGFDDGSRGIPDGFPKSRSLYNNNNTTVQEKIANTKLFDNPYAVETTTAMPIQSYQINWGNVRNFKNEGTLGSILSLTYRNGQTYQGATRETFDGIETNYQYNDQVYKYNTTLGALANFSYKKGKSKYSFKNLFNQTFDDSYTDRTGTNINQGNIIYSGSELNQKGLFNTQLEGEHRFGEKNSKLDWNLNYSVVTRNQPDLRNILYNQSGSNPYSFADNFSRRFYSDLTENIYGINAAYTIPFTFLEKKSNIKFGGLKQIRKRDFNSRNFIYQAASFGNFDASKLTLPKEVIVNDENISETGFVFNEITNNSDSYNGYSDLNAGYVMLDNQLSDKIRLVWGARAESYFQDINALGNSGLPISADQTFFDVLPSFNLTYNFNDKANLRFSGSQTVTRPELRELAPFTFINQEENTLTAGNPNLKRSNNTNADIRFEYYPTNGEAFTATVFYKNFKNPIEQIVGSSATYSNLTFNFNNVKSAYSYGFELDFRKRLDFLGNAAWLENFTVASNLTLIKSEVDLGNQSTAAVRPLQGQSPYLVNGSIQYNSPKSGVSLNVLYNRIGSRIARVGNENIPDFYEIGRDLLDLQVSKKILKNKGELRLNIGDVLNQSQILYQNFDGNRKYNKGIDNDFFNYKTGTNFTLGFTYDFSFAN